ncbi:hypothetical protein BC830DRAFT_741923 [Chytriomyces sp. MP71]|nr:hypothetical protein BC830DRAFT_741923 [Chytriomyces sp. MP71]
MKLPSLPWYHMTPFDPTSHLSNQIKLVPLHDFNSPILRTKFSSSICRIDKPRLELVCSAGHPHVPHTDSCSPPTSIDCHHCTSMGCHTQEGSFCFLSSWRSVPCTRDCQGYRGGVKLVGLKSGASGIAAKISRRNCTFHARSAPFSSQLLNVHVFGLPYQAEVYSRHN